MIVNSRRDFVWEGIVGNIINVVGDHMTAGSRGASYRSIRRVKSESLLSSCLVSFDSPASEPEPSAAGSMSAGGCVCVGGGVCGGNSPCRCSASTVIYFSCEERRG